MTETKISGRVAEQVQAQAWRAVKEIQKFRGKYTFYGGAREIMDYKGPEALIHGPAETGKTLGCLAKIHELALSNIDASIVIMRKTLASTYGSVIQTYENKILGSNENNWPCSKYGGEKPQWYDYFTGTRVWVTGMDKASKILSSEHDIIYVNQAEEFSLDEWETLTTRVTGRAGNLPYAQLIGDANPTYPTAWVYHRKAMHTIQSKHRHNPFLYDQMTGELTPQGRITMTILEKLTGVRRDRLLDGNPSRAEGVIYPEYDPSEHRVYRENVPVIRRWIGGVDWGYTHAGVLGMWGLDNEDAMFLMGQVYHTGRQVEWFIERAKEFEEEFGPAEAWVCDPSEPSYIAKFNANGLRAIPGFNAVSPGIDAVKTRFSDNRLFFVYNNLRHQDETLRENRLPTCTEEEIPAYVWADKVGKEVPVKENDHGADHMRYVVAHVDKIEKPRLKDVDTHGLGEVDDYVNPYD